MKKSNEYSNKEIKVLLDQMVSIRDILMAHGYSVPLTGNMKCPFHFNEVTPAAKYYAESNSIYCFSEHKKYTSSDALVFLGEDYHKIFADKWDKYDDETKQDIINKSEEVVEYTLTFREPLQKFKLNKITYSQLCDEISKLLGNSRTLDILYKISTPIERALVGSDDYTYLACLGNLNNVKQLSSEKAAQYVEELQVSPHIINFIEEYGNIVIIFNMAKNKPIGCTIRSKKSHNFIDVGNTGGVFYNLCNMANDFKYGDRITLVEGPKDCEAYKMAFNDKNCLAILTSDLSVTQLEVLSYLTNNIVLANDNDDAGHLSQRHFIRWNRGKFKINTIKHPDDLKDFGDLIKLYRTDRDELKLAILKYKIQINNFN